MTPPSTPQDRVSDIPRRHLTFDGPDPQDSHHDTIEVVANVPPASASASASASAALGAPFVTQPTRSVIRRSQTQRRSRAHRPPSLELRCSLGNASSSDSEHGLSISSFGGSASAAAGVDHKLSSSSSTFALEKPPPSASSSWSTEFDHTWLPPSSPVARMNSVRSPALVQQAVPSEIKAAPTLGVLLGTAGRRDLILLGIPATLAALLSGLVPPVLTKILQEAFDAFAKFNPSGAPIQAISDGAKEALKSAISTVVWQLVALALAALVLSLISASAWTSLGERTASRARLECYQAVSEKEMAWFDKGTAGEKKEEHSMEGSHGPAGLATTFSRDADDIRAAYVIAFAGLLRASATTITAFVLAFTRSWKLAFVTLAAVPVAAVLTALCERASGPLLHAERSALAETSQVIQQAVSAITVVKAFNGQERELGRLRLVLQKSSQAWNRTSFVWSLRSGLASSLMLAMFVQGFWYGSHIVQTGEASAGLVMNVFWSCLLITTSIEQGLRALLPLHKGRIAAANIRTICTVQPSGTVWVHRNDVEEQRSPLWMRVKRIFTKSGPGTPRTTAMPIDAIPHANNAPTSPVSRKLSLEQTASLTTSPRSLKRSRSARVAAMRKVRPSNSCSGELSFRSVSFAYPSRPGVLALANVDMFIPSGETTFIIGASGSGKSTISSLLLRLYRPLCGEIFVDNHSLGFLDPNWCLENILVLSQSPVIFDMTIHDNIAIGKTARAKVSGDVDPHTGIPLVSRDDIIAASRTALLHEFVLGLPDGYDTVLGNKGVNLSGGQKQRLAIARARLCDPTVLVLDEATAALDPSSRLLVHEAVRKWRAHSTTVIITHDLTQVGPDDYTYVMDNGRVVENGYRRHLERARDGKLRAILKAQAQLHTAVIVHSPISQELPTSPTGLEAQASMRLDQVLKASADADVEKARMSAAFGSMQGLSLRPLSVAFGSAGSGKGSHRKTLPIGWLPEAKGTASRPGSLATEAEWLDRMGQAAARGRRGYRRSRLESRNVPNAFRMEKGALTSSRLDIPDTAIAPAGFIAVSRQAWAKQPRRIVTLLGLLACVASGCTMPIFSYFLAQLLSTMAATGQNHKVLRYSLLTLVLAFLDGLCLFLRQFVMETVAELWIRQLREEAFSKVLRQGMAWFNLPDNRADRISHSLVRDGEDARNLVGQVWGQLLAVATMLFMACLWAIIVGWQLTFVALAFVPLFAGVVFLQSRALARVEAVNKTKRDTVTKRFFGLVANIRAIRSMALDQIFMCRFVTADRECFRSGLRSGPIAGLGLGLAEGMTYLAEAVLFYVGAVLIVQGHYTFERMVVVFNLMVFAVTYSSQMLVNLPGLSKSSHAAWSLARLTGLPNDTEEYQGAGRARLDGTIDFEDVGFQYSGDRFPVLKNLSFSIPAGQTVAIVGGSGCGKTTVTNLLQRLYEPTQGSIKISGIPIDQLDICWLREHLSVVSQSPMLFNMSVADNIAYGDNGFPTPSLGSASGGGDNSARHQLRTQGAASWAQMDRTIRKFPAGYATKLGDDGAQLSGGQAQRVAVARALMRQFARILILDEFTSALDRARQAELIDLLLLRRQGRIRVPNGDGRDLPRWFQDRDVSVVVVTHNLEVMKSCDRILVLAEGRVVQDGSFEQLISIEGEFATLTRAGEWGFGKQK